MSKNPIRETLQEHMEVTPAWEFLKDQNLKTEARLLFITREDECYAWLGHSTEGLTKKQTVHLLSSLRGCIEQLEEQSGLVYTPLDEKHEQEESNLLNHLEEELHLLKGQKTALEITLEETRTELLELLNRSSHELTWSITLSSIIFFFLGFGVSVLLYSTNTN